LVNKIILIVKYAKIAFKMVLAKNKQNTIKIAIRCLAYKDLVKSFKKSKRII